MSVVFSIMPILAFVMFLQSEFYFVKEWIGIILSGTYLCFLLHKIGAILINCNKSVDRGLYIVQSVGKDKESKDLKSSKYTLINTKLEASNFKGKLETPLFPGSIVRAFTLGNTRLIKKVELINSRSVPATLNHLGVLSIKNNELISSNFKKNSKFGSNSFFNAALVIVILFISLSLHSEYSAFKYGEPYQKTLKNSSKIQIGSDERFERYKLSLDVSFIYEVQRSKRSHYYIKVLDESGNLLFTIDDKQNGLQEHKVLNGILTFVIYEEKKTGDVLIFENQDVKLEISN